MIRDKLVMPEVYAFNNMIMLLLKAEGLKNATEMAEPMKKWDPKMVASQIKQFQMSKMYGGLNYKFKVSVPLAMNLNPDITSLTGISPAWVWTILRKQIMLQKGAALLQGKAPPGDLERQIQLFLDK